MAELTYNSQRNAYETTLDNGDILSVDAQEITENIYARLNGEYEGVRRDMMEDHPGYDEARTYVLDASNWDDSLFGVTLIHPDGSMEWEDMGRRLRQEANGDTHFIPMPGTEQTGRAYWDKQLQRWMPY